MPQRLVTTIATRGAQILRRVEAISRPRFRPLVEQDRLLALMCLVLAMVIAMPIPFGNMLPALCVLLMALGMIQRDGLLAALGLAGGLVLLAFVGLAGNAIMARLFALWPVS